MEKALWLMVSFVVGMVIIGIIVLIAQSTVGEGVSQMQNWIGAAR